MQKLGDNCYANPVVDRRNYSDCNAHEIKQGEKELRFFGAALGAFLFANSQENYNTFQRTDKI